MHRLKGQLRRFSQILFILSILQACSHSIHQQYIGSMDPDVTYGDGKWISVESQDFVVLALAFNTDYVEKGMNSLEAKCPGRLAQVTTEHVTSFKFLSYEQRVIFKGLCLRAS